MKLKYSVLVAIIVMFSNIVMSQEGLPIYTDYLTDNNYLIHPSMAGVANCAKIRITGRQQWFGQDNAPKLLTMSINGRVGDSQSGIGGVLYADENGFHSQKGAYFTYAHHIMFSRTESDLNMLSFGLSAGFLQYQLDETSFLNGGSMQDPNISGIVQSETNFNIDLGFSYHYLNFYAHVTIKNVLENSGVNKDTQITSNLRRYLASVGYVFGKYDSPWSYEPSVLFQYRDLTKDSAIDINGKVYRQMDFGKLWGGLSYRKNLSVTDFSTRSNAISSQNLEQITPILGLNYNNFMFAYTYTYELSDVVFARGGFHQITLGYNFNCRKEDFRCNCPAVN